MDVDKKRERLREVLCKAPKPQLHLHLDGSLSYSFIRESMKRLNEANSSPRNYFFGSEHKPESGEELRQWLMEFKETQIKGGSVANKNSNWKVFDFCNQFLQTTKDLHSATYDLVCSLNKGHNVTYMEIRFAPVLHTLTGLTEEGAVVAAVGGFKQAVSELSSKNITIDGGIILCALRSYPVSNAYETLELCKKNIPGVLGFDIAGDEGTYPLSLFREVLVAAKSSSINVTVHAGEWNEKIHPTSLENVQLALELKLERIGHGLATRSAGRQLIDELTRKKVPVEVCLTSNCGNPTKCKNLAEHPLPAMVRQGINVAGLNVDNLLLSGNLELAANPTDECVRALLDCGLSATELVEVIENGYRAGFANETRAAVTASAMKEWREHFLLEVAKILTED